MARTRRQPVIADVPPEPVEEDDAPVIQPNVARVLLDQRVIREISREVPGFNRSGLLADLFNEWGRKKGKDGQAALAEAMVDEFESAKAGSISRQRILDMICRLINWHSDDVQAQPVEEMSEEELINSIRAALPRLEVVASTPEPCEPEI